MTRFIMIASSKGGIGKSTTAIGLSLSLCDMGKTVLLCDLDYGNACLDMLLSCEDSVLYTSLDASLENCTPKDALIKPWDNKSIYLLPAPGGGNAEICDGNSFECDGSADKTKLKSVIYECAAQVNADFVILDTGAGVNAGAALAAEMCSLSLIIAGHSPVSLRSAESTAARLAKFGDLHSLLIINSFDADGVLSKKGEGRNSIITIIDTCRVQLFGIVPYDYELSLYQEGHSKAKPVLSDAAYKNIAKRLCGESVPLFYGMKRHRKLRNKFYK